MIPVLVAGLFVTLVVTATPARACMVGLECTPPLPRADAGASREAPVVLAGTVVRQRGVIRIDMLAIEVEAVARGDVGREVIAIIWNSGPNPKEGRRYVFALADPHPHPDIASEPLVRDLVGFHELDGDLPDQGWHPPDAQVPSEWPLAVVRPPTLWERYDRAFLVGALVAAVCTCLILARRSRREARHRREKRKPRPPGGWTV